MPAVFAVGLFEELFAASRALITTRLVTSVGSRPLNPVTAAEAVRHRIGARA